MAKKLTVEQATQRVIDTINVMADPESANIDKYMKRYASLRELDSDGYERVYRDISESLFGHWSETAAEEAADEAEEVTSLVVAMPTEIAPMDQEAGEPDGTNFVTLEDVGYILQGLGEIAGMAFDEIRADAPMVARMVKEGLQLVGVMGLTALDVLAFWIPELARRLLFWMAWVLRPEAEHLSRMTWRASRAFGRAAASEARTCGLRLMALWELREELIAEYKEVA